MTDSGDAPETPESPDEEARPRTGKADTWNVAGSDVQQPEVAEGPVEGLQPGEQVERGPWQPPVEVDAPPNTAVDPDEEPSQGLGEDLSQEAAMREGLGEPSDPGGAPEDEGIPDLQEGTPAQQRANDPQQEPVPGDTPTAVTQNPPTPAEMREGESLDERLAEEEPDTGSVPPGEEDPATGDSPASDAAVPETGTGRLLDERESAPFRDQDVFGEGVGTEGLSAEEEAVRTRDEEE